METEISANMCRKPSIGKRSICERAHNFARLYVVKNGRGNDDATSTTRDFQYTYGTLGTLCDRSALRIESSRLLEFVDIARQHALIFPPA